MRRLCAFIVFGLMFAAVSVAQVPVSNHVVLVVEENHSYSGVIGNSAMPYLNSLASKYGLATQYYANTHPSIGNYFEMTTGQILTNNDSQTPATLPVSADNLVRQLMVAGKTWKSYAEGLPTVGYTGGDTGLYAVRHNPFAYFTDVQNSSAQKLNLVPFSQFSTDLANNNLPNFSYVVPNLNNDAHNGTLQQADAWLQQNIAPLLANAAFQQDGILIITFDESVDADTAHGGGQIATLIIGPKTKLGYKSTTLYQHQSLLRTVLSALGASSYPGAAASAPVMGDFFVSQTTTQATSGGVTISAPASGATVTSPVRFVASATSSSSSYPITAMRLYVDNQSKYTVSAASLSTSLSLAAGSHYVAIVAWDASGKSYWKSENITVNGTTAAGVTISSPGNGATVSSPVTFRASATAVSGRTITAMRIYDNNNIAYTVGAASLNTSLSMAAGAHYVVIQAWDNTGAVYRASENITVSSPATTGTLSVSPTSLSFGSVNVGSNVSKSITVTASTAAVTLSQANISGAGYSVSGVTLPATISAGQSLSLSVKFAPTTTGTTSGSLSLVSNATNPTVAVGLSGTGATVVGTLGVSPSSLSFGSVNVGSSASQTVTLSASTAAVTISQANVSGAGFSVSGLSVPTTISAGQSVSFSVKFAPTVAGAASGSIAMVSNASNANASVGLSGTGATTTTQSHSVALTWNASASTNIVGYNVYRATQSGGPYTKITSATVSGTTYTDSNVTSGASYYYAVTAVDNNGVESGYSNSASAVIPTP